MKILIISNMFPSKHFPSYGIFVKHFCDQMNDLNVKYSLSAMTRHKLPLNKICGYLHFYIVSFFKCLFGRYDLVYVHYASHSSPPVLAAHRLRNFTIYTNAHGSDIVPENKKQERFQKYTNQILHLSQKIIVPSSYFKTYVAEKYALSKSMIFVSPSGGIDPAIFHKIGPKETDSTLKIGYVGRISYQKGWDTLLNACALLKIQYEIVIVGSGPENSSMLKLADALKLNDKIKRFDLLPQEKLLEIYNTIDVLVFPTRRQGESLGLVAIEAMACGTPVIASDYAAPSSYIIDGQNGYKFQVGDYKDLADTLTRYSALSSEKREQLSNDALKTASAYSEKNVLAGMKAIIGC